MKYILTIKNTIKELDIKLKKLMNNGFKFSLILILIASYILTGYQNSGNPNLFYIGISLFKSASYFGIAFFIFAISFNKIKKEIF